MTMFEYYRQNVKIKDRNGNELTYELKPLSGRYLPKLYNIMKKFGQVDKEKEDSMEFLEPELMSDLHTLALETMKASYPKEDENELDIWVSQNLLTLLEPLIKVNMGDQAQGLNNDDTRTE